MRDSSRGTACKSPLTTAALTLALGVGLGCVPSAHQREYGRAAADERALCEALIRDDRAAVAAEIDAHLAAGPAGDPLEVQLEGLRRWLADLPCVSSAALLPELLDTEPPVQQLHVALITDGGEPLGRLLGMVLDPAGLRFNER
jgi:hypothetical protein